MGGLMGKALAIGKTDGDGSPDLPNLTGGPSPRERVRPSGESMRLSICREVNGPDWTVTPSVEFVVAATLSAVLLEFLAGLLYGTMSLRLLGLVAVLSAPAAALFGALTPKWEQSRRLEAWILLLVCGHLVTLIQIHQNLRWHSDWTTMSDDSYYVQNGALFAKTIARADDWAGYLEAYKSLPKTSHNGYIVVLGHLFSQLEDDRHIFIRAALSLNLLALVVLAAAVANAARVSSANSRRFSLIWCVAALEGFYLATLVLKDVVLLLGLYLAAWALVRISTAGLRIGLFLLLCAGTVCIFFFRTVYSPLPFAAGLLALLFARRPHSVRRSLSVIIASLVLAGLPALMQRSVWYERFVGGGSSYKLTSIDARKGGGGAAVFGVPYVGRLLYAFVSPVPPTPKYWNEDLRIVEVVRGTGTIAILILLGQIIWAKAWKNLKGDPELFAFVILSVLFLLTGAYFAPSLESRYKTGMVFGVIALYGGARLRNPSRAVALSGSRSAHRKLVKRSAGVPPFK